jgi:hypothetical protein
VLLQTIYYDRFLSLPKKHTFSELHKYLTVIGVPFSGRNLLLLFCILNKINFYNLRLPLLKYFITHNISVPFSNFEYNKDNYKASQLISCKVFSSPLSKSGLLIQAAQ